MTATIIDLFAHLSHFLQRENIKYIYNTDESPVFSIILTPPSKICMIDINPSEKGDVLLIQYNYPFDDKTYLYAGLILDDFPITLTQLLSILFIDLKIGKQLLPEIIYLADSEEIGIATDPQNYKYSYQGSFEIKRKQLDPL